MSTVTAVGGFDKEIELKMLKKVVRSFILMMLLFMMKKIQKRGFGNRRWLGTITLFSKRYWRLLKT
jgi:hypothetical protein